MSLRKDLSNKDKFIITAELNPPKGTDAKPTLEKAQKIRDLVSAINITDNSGAGMKMSPLALCHLIQIKLGVDTIWQMTCRDRNRLALQSDLLGGIPLGIKNILPLRGDDPKISDHPGINASYDLGTEELLEAIQKLKEGKDLADNEVKVEAVPFDYCVGSAAHPGLPDLNAQTETMKRRIDLGVEFFQSQICFEKEQINKFYEAIGDELASKTILGITPIKSLKQAEFMNKNIFGVTVPEDSLKHLETASDQQAKGLELARELVEHIKTMPFKGIHVMAIGQENILDTVIQKLTTFSGASSHSTAAGSESTTPQMQ